MTNPRGMPGPPPLGLNIDWCITGGAFDRLNWQHSGELDQNFSKKSNAPGFARGGGWAVLELTGTLSAISPLSVLNSLKIIPIQSVLCTLRASLRFLLCHVRHHPRRPRGS